MAIATGTDRVDQISAALGRCLSGARAANKAKKNNRQTSNARFHGILALLKLRHVLIHDPPLTAYLDPREAAAGVGDDGIAAFVGIIDDGVPVRHDDGIVG